MMLSSSAVDRVLDTDWKPRRSSSPLDSWSPAAPGELSTQSEEFRTPVGLRGRRRAPAVLGNEPGGTSLGLEEAHRELKISPAEFDEVAAELGRTLDHFEVPEREKEEVLGAFAAHKDEVNQGYFQ